MKIGILSDLHIEFAPFEPGPTTADVIVLAGDIGVGYEGLAWAERTYPHVQVVYVLGNHEYYGEAIPEHTNAIKALARKSHVHVLENDSVTIHGVRFLGCTLWTDFALFGEPSIAGYVATQQVTDFERIRVQTGHRQMSWIDTAIIHKNSVEWLTEEIGKDLTESGVTATVVVTHHAPSSRSLAERYRTDILSATFASDLESLVASSGVALWVHGHLHSSSDYHLGTTRVVCNPRGYPNEANADFRPDLLIDVLSDLSA